MIGLSFIALITLRARLSCHSFFHKIINGFNIQFSFPEFKPKVKEMTRLYGLFSLYFSLESTDASHREPDLSAIR
jgi:hypothetical protein